MKLRSRKCISDSKNGCIKNPINQTVSGFSAVPFLRPHLLVLVTRAHPKCGTKRSKWASSGQKKGLESFFYFHQREQFHARSTATFSPGKPGGPGGPGGPWNQRERLNLTPI